MFTLNEMLEAIVLQSVDVKIKVSPRLTATIRVDLRSHEERDEVTKLYGDYIVQKFDMPNLVWPMTIMLSNDRKNNEKREEDQR